MIMPHLDDWASRGGIARAKKLDAARRSSIARRAARVRWDPGLVKMAEIKRQVARALIDRPASAYLFGSYARHEATPRSDVDLMVVLASPDADWFDETAVIRGKLDFGKPIDLIVVDADTYERWKGEEGSVQYEVAKTGVRLV